MREAVTLPSAMPRSFAKLAHFLEIGRVSGAIPGAGRMPA
jgi:hypothetical protein